MSYRNGCLYFDCKGGGELRIGKGCFIGSGCKIMCFNSIKIGFHCDLTWETQLMDTSFHYIRREQTSVPDSLTKPIIIGDFCWIGNRTTISKGTILPDYSIVASNSVVNKDFSDCGKNCMYAGVPAKLKATNVVREYDTQKEAELDKIYNYTRRHL